jgi:hypothetical protein
MSLTLHIERVVIDAALTNGEPAGSVHAAIERALAAHFKHANGADDPQPAGATIGQPSMPPPALAHPHQQLGAQIAIAVQRAVNPTATTPQGRKAP